MTASTVDNASENQESTHGHGPSERRGYQAWTQNLPAGAVKTVVSKLFTNEDNMQIHKFFGFLAVASFVYRYFYMFPTRGNLGFEGTWFDHLTIFVHMALSTSSLVFHVIKRRVLNRPMIIWEEYRLHAISFSTRCASVYAIGYFRPFAGTWLERVLIPAVVLAHHVVADKITEMYGAKDGTTTVRVKDNHASEIKSVLRFYAFYQFSALASHVVPNARMMDLGYNTFIAIQSSAFLMTLYRKGVISEVSHGIWYTFCLVLSLIQIFMNCGTALFIAKLATAYILRTDFKVDKYVLWISFALLSVPEVEMFLVEQLSAITQDTFGVSLIGLGSLSFFGANGISNLSN